MAVGELVASLERVKIYSVCLHIPRLEKYLGSKCGSQASCEDLQRRCQWLLRTLEENSAYMEPDETLQATQTLDR